MFLFIKPHVFILYAVNTLPLLSYLGEGLFCILHNARMLSSNNDTNWTDVNCWIVHASFLNLFCFIKIIVQCTLSPVVVIIKNRYRVGSRTPPTTILYFYIVNYLCLIGHTMHVPCTAFLFHHRTSSTYIVTHIQWKALMRCFLVAIFTLYLPI